MSPIFTVTFPDIGEGVCEGEVVSWLKEEGDTLLLDEPVVSVMTDKATVELPSPHPGILRKLHVPEGQIVKKGAPLYEIELEQALPDSLNERVKTKQSVECAKKSPQNKVVHSSSKAVMSPKARKIAKALGVDLKSLSQKAGGERIYATDLYPQESHVKLAELDGDRIVSLVGAGRMMARKMTESKKQTCPFSFFERVEATKLISLKESMQQRGTKTTYLPFFIRALSKTLETHEMFNAAFDGESEKLYIRKEQNIAIAMALEEGLFTPHIKGCQNLSLFEIMEKVSKLKEKAKNRTFSIEEMRGSTITISNFGGLNEGGIFATPLLSPPEVAILGFSPIRKEAVCVGDQVVAKDVIFLSFTFDHRVIDGKMAILFSKTLKENLENPLRLL